MKEEKLLSLVRGKRYEVSNNEDFSDSDECIFINYDEGFKEPYRCIANYFISKYHDKERIETNTWKYIREIQPKFKAYEETDTRMIDTMVIEKSSGEEFEIVALTRGVSFELILRDKDGYRRIENVITMFRDYTLLNGKPFGKKTNND